VEARLEEARRSLASGDFATAVSLARRARSVPGHERSEATLAVWDDLCARLPRRALRSAWEDARLQGHEDQVLGVAVDPSGPARSRPASTRRSGCGTWPAPGRRRRSAATRAP
jgi:hypothetical protein